MFGLNLFLWKFQKCSSYDKWTFMRHASETEAEEKRVDEPSEEEKLRKRIEESRYEKTNP